MTSSSESELSFEQQELRKVSAKLEMIEAIQMAKHENDLNTYKLKLEKKEQDYRDILKKPTEVYLLLFLCIPLLFFLHMYRGSKSNFREKVKINQLQIMNLV